MTFSSTSQSFLCAWVKLLQSSRVASPLGSFASVPVEEKVRRERERARGSQPCTVLYRPVQSTRSDMIAHTNQLTATVAAAPVQ